MEIEEIIKLIVGILIALETIGCFISYKLNFKEKLNPYFYLLSVVSMIGFFVYLSIDETLFIASNHYSTYLILFGIIIVIQIVGCIILYNVIKNDNVEESEVIEENVTNQNLEAIDENILEDDKKIDTEELSKQEVSEEKKAEVEKIEQVSLDNVEAITEERPVEEEKDVKKKRTSSKK